jgi:fibronectin type 3 domain-containing protein
MEINDPSSFATYAIEVLNPEGRGAGISNQVHVSLVRTLPPPGDLQAHVAKQGVVLTWTGVSLPTPLPPRVHYVYRVYRHAEGSTEQLLAGEVTADRGTGFTLTDANIEWEKTYEYRVETVTVIDGATVAELTKPQVQVEGDDSPEIRVVADDVFPPSVPSALQAVFSGPGQQAFVDLVWAPVSDFDLAGYNIYRHEEGTAPIKLNAELVKTPAYRDANVMPSKKYVYSVSAVDVRGNESARSEEASEVVP